jgi:hypothetical protein
MFKYKMLRASLGVASLALASCAALAQQRSPSDFVIDRLTEKCGENTLVADGLSIREFKNPNVKVFRQFVKPTEVAKLNYPDFKGAVKTQYYVTGAAFRVINQNGVGLWQPIPIHLASGFKIVDMRHEIWASDFKITSISTPLDGLLIGAGEFGPNRPRQNDFVKLTNLYVKTWQQAFLSKDIVQQKCEDFRDPRLNIYQVLGDSSSPQGFFDLLNARMVYQLRETGDAKDPENSIYLYDNNYELWLRQWGWAIDISNYIMQKYGFEDDNINSPTDVILATDDVFCRTVRSADRGSFRRKYCQ